MFEAEEGLGLSVARLLAQVSARILPPMMPDERPGSEGDPITGLLQTPANIDIIAGLAKQGIEAVDCQEGVAAEGHVAAGNMLGDLIALQDMDRLSRRRG